MATVIAIANQKGGVGKSITTLNLGYALTTFNKKVLLIDFDPQESLTIALGFEPEKIKVSVYDALIDRMPLGDVIERKGDLYIAPSHLDLAAAEVILLNEIGRENTLKNCIKPIRSDFDYILIDCPPSLGLLTVNALCASNFVISPVTPEFLALRGFYLLEGSINKVKKINENLALLGILITMFDSRTTHHKEVVNELKSKYPVFNAIIKRSVAFSDATLSGQSLIEFDPRHEGSKEYLEFAKEVIEECQRKRTE